MLHTKFHENRPAGSGEEDFCRFWRRRFLKSVYGRQSGQGQDMTLTLINHIPSSTP